MDLLFEGNEPSLASLEGLYRRAASMHLSNKKPRGEGNNQTSHSWSDAIAKIETGFEELTDAMQIETDASKTAELRSKLDLFVPLIQKLQERLP